MVEELNDIKYLMILIFMVLLVGCKSDNVLNETTYNEHDFVVSCLKGVEYYFRKAGTGSYMSPVIDKETLNFVRCGE